MMQFFKGIFAGATAIALAFSVRASDCAERTNSGEVTLLIEQLGSPEYQVRDSATRQLQAAGAQVVPRLAKVAESDDVEASFRAIGILQSFADGSDERNKPSAVEALRLLASSQNPSVAAAADNALTLDRLNQRAAAI